MTESSANCSPNLDALMSGEDKMVEPMGWLKKALF
jgi:hypothetical protein